MVSWFCVFSSHRMRSMHRCGLLLHISTHAWSVCVCMCVCVSVCHRIVHDHEPCKTAEPIKMPFGETDSRGPVGPCIRWGQILAPPGTCRRHLADTIERLVSGGDAVYSYRYCSNLFNFLCDINWLHHCSGIWSDVVRRFWGAVKVASCVPDIRRMFVTCVESCRKLDCRWSTRPVTSFPFTSVTVFHVLRGMCTCLLGSLHTVSLRAVCFGRRICLSSVCLFHVKSRKLTEIGAKFRQHYGKSGSRSKNRTSDFAPEVVKYPKSSYFGSVRAYCFAPLAMQLVTRATLWRYTIARVLGIGLCLEK